MRRTQLIWPNGFPTEVRATAGGFCYHQGAIFGGLTAPILTFFAVNMHLGFAIPMLIGTITGCASLNCRDPAIIREGQLHPNKPTVGQLFR